MKANAASEAVLAFERNDAEIDLVLSDVQMPGLNGWELAGELRLRSPNLPIVFMSGGTEGCAASDVLQKPFKMADLWLRISDALKRVQAYNPPERVCEMNPLA